MRRKTKKKSPGSCLHFPPKSRLGGRQSRGLRPVEGSQAGRASEQPPFSLPGATEKDRRREGRRAAGKEEEGGRSEGARKAVSKREEGKTAARIQRDHKPYASSSRKSESASARPPRRLGPDSPQTCPNRPQTLSGSLLQPPPNSPPSCPPPLFQKPKQHKRGRQKPPKPADSLRQQD